MGNMLQLQVCSQSEPGDPITVTHVLLENNCSLMRDCLFQLKVGFFSPCEMRLLHQKVEHPPTPPLLNPY